MSKAQALQLKAGTLIEDDTEDDSNKLPSKRQLIRAENKFDSLPSTEIIRRLYRRHSTGFWQFMFIATWAVVITAAVR